MSRVLEMLAAVLANDRVIGVADAILLAMGLTCTVASVAPALARVFPERGVRR
jgi:hypothetical protein